jgi:hypothetical protein
MKKQMFVLIGLALMLSSALVHAQTIAMKANVPFNFIVSGKALPAGEYTVQTLYGGEVLLIQGGGNTVSVVSSHRCESATASNNSKLIFRRTQGTYFLTQVWSMGSTAGRELPKSHPQRERELAQNAPVVVLAE